MKTITLLTIVIATLLSPVAYSQNNIKAVWMDIAKDYKDVEINNKGVPDELVRTSITKSTTKEFHEGELRVSVGLSFFALFERERPFETETIKEDNEADFYSIVIIHNDGEFETDLARLNVPLKYISPAKLHAHANVVVKYDAASGLITINLGKTVFKCKLNNKKLG